MNHCTKAIAKRLPSQAQWIMLVTTLLIASFLFLANQAHAQHYFQRNYTGPLAYAQTISHCGVLKTRSVVYGRYHRPYRNQRNARIIQTQLERLGYSVGRPGIDGMYGPRTRRAVIKFQRDHQLRQDGIVGKETSQRLAYEAHPVANVRNCNHLARFTRR